jgi:hypothetical protein
MGLTLKRRERRGDFVYIIPNGTVVDGGTVSKTSWPDAVPTTNYTDWQFDDIESTEPIREVETETISVPQASGGYNKEEEPSVTKRAWKHVTSKANSLLKQLEHGTSSAIAAGVPQTPGGSNVPFIDCVYLRETVGSDGTVLARIQVWARLTLISSPKSENATGKYEFQVQQLYSSLNTIQEN